MEDIIAVVVACILLALVLAFGLLGAGELVMCDLLGAETLCQ